MGYFNEAFCGGYECLVSWADLLDLINVFPVADADTGSNLKISLAPFHDLNWNKAYVYEQLSLSALGNSGNIAVSFFREFCRADTFPDLAKWADIGSEKARQAVLEPQDGTMLNVFDRLAQVLGDKSLKREIAFSRVSGPLQDAVLATSKQIPDLDRAGVVDSGALGMFIFLDAFFKILAGREKISCPVSRLFKGKLKIRDSFSTAATKSYCVDAVIDLDNTDLDLKNKFSKFGKSIILVPDKSRLKVHIHTRCPDDFRSELASLGKVIKWADEDIDAQGKLSLPLRAGRQTVHIVTDAAGSISPEIAEKHGITLLDSYIVSGNESRPESSFSAEQIYSRLKKGVKLTTAQASTFERHQRYAGILQQFERVLYLCVGAVYTGNYAIVSHWKQNHDPDDRLMVMDTGAASGRLAVIALLTARYAAGSNEPGKVIDFAEKAINSCEEYIFINQLKYLAAGGRLSKTSGFFGDLLRMKPVVSPTKKGAVKVGVVRNRPEQLQFAVNKLQERLDKDFRGLIMLQYSDNKEWLVKVAQPEIDALFPQAEIVLTPLSLTSGVHMGPGTWALAFLP